MSARVPIATDSAIEDFARHRPARQPRPGIGSLFTTEDARNAIVHNGWLDAGVQPITKPFSFDDLAARVSDVLDKKFAG